MRRKGIASKLLEQICQDAANDGFDFAESYPKKKFVNVCDDYQGPVELYKKNGFSVYYESDNNYVMRKALK